MAEILDARVKQKTGTAAEFAGYQLLEGEIALVRTSANGPVWNFKVGPGNFDSLDWSLQNPGAAQKADTSTVFPSGVPGLYIPTEDGTYDGVPVDLSSGYTQLIWDGSALVKAEFPIDLSGYVAKEEIMTTGKNMFNKDGTINNGGYLNSTTGAITTSANGAYSDYIAVDPNTTYTLSGVLSLASPAANVVVFYDASKSVISWVSNTGFYTHTTPANTAFVRFNIRHNVPIGDADYSQVQYELGSEATPYEPYIAGVVDGSKINYNNTPDNSLSLSKLVETIESRNLFTGKGIVDGVYLNSTTGNTSSSANAAISDYIPTKPNTTYTLSGAVSLNPPAANVVVFYDASKSVISWVSNLSNYTHTTPAGTAFVRFNVRFGTPVGNADYSRLQYEEGSAATPYVKPGAVLDSSFIQMPVPSTETEPAPVADVYMVPCYGQSLSINTDAGPSTFTDPVSIAYDTSLNNTNIQDMNGGYAEMFLMLSKGFKPLNPDFKMMTCLGGAGGKSVLELSRGSTYYTTLMNNIIAGKTTADANGLSYNVPAFMWTQGEEDYRCGGVPADYGSGDWDPLEYADKLRTLVDQINEDVKTITGQKNDVKCIMYQNASHNAYYRYPRIALEQLRAAMEDERIVLAKTMYDVDYNPADYVHAPAKTYRNMGNHYGLALFEAICMNKRVLPIFPQQWFIEGTDVIIKFHVPVKPLMMDTTNVAGLPDGNYGFALYEVQNETDGTSGTISAASEIITSVSIEEDEMVRISLSALPPAGTRLTYGVNGGGHLSIGGTGTGARSGRTEGARGNLRDSRSYKNQVADYFQLYNWCPIFEIIL